ncbi:hypothetical protein EDC65_1704 [Stella humosa]|uniref:Uncharacterized protein n=1 Tax=Stella humosa TaxID=94 RepID=A0A3N1MAX8_9PROT|nr:hypothetical protein [Stella humosa]ROP99909.1 hypothetical protein EDC65_1704 [Stella humosa]BBK30861.1 hypothetical protein STHU_14950 [Stella humosa]
MPTDPSPSVSAALIQAQGLELHGLSLTIERAGELAAEVARIQAQMAAIVPPFWFFDEPMQFLAVLDELARPEDGR